MAQIQLIVGISLFLTELKLEFVEQPIQVIFIINIFTILPYNTNIPAVSHLT
jgi:hypothetical protein